MFIHNKKNCAFWKLVCKLLHNLTPDISTKLIDNLYRFYIIKKKHIQLMFVVTGT